MDMRFFSFMNKRYIRYAIICNQRNVGVTLVTRVLIVSSPLSGI